MSNSSDFVIEDGRLVKYVGPGGDVVIPDGVTVICDDAFEKCKLNSVSIPKSVEAIGKYAFFDNHIKTVRIPKHVTYIGQGAFDGIEVIELYDSYQCSPCSFGRVINNKKHIIVVLSAETDEVLFKVPMFDDGYSLDSGLYAVLRGSAWQKDAPVFDFEMLDNYFKKIKFPETKAAIAEFRINNPYSLSDEHKNMYAAYLKRTQKKRDSAVDDPARKNFEIKGNELLRFTGDESVTEAIIPDGIKKISSNAFIRKNSLTRIVIPEGVTTVELFLLAFTGCSDTLESISIPESLIGLSYHDFERLKQLKYNEYKNGLYLGNERNPYLYFLEVRDRGITNLEIADGTKYIGKDALRDCPLLREIVLPNSVARIEEQPEGVFTSSKRINMPSGYLKTSDQLPVATSLTLVQSVWKEQVSFEDYVWIYLFQTGVSIDAFSSTMILKDTCRAMDEMLCALERYPRPSAYKKAVQYAYQNKEQISRDKLQKLFNDAQKAKVKSPEMDLLQKLLGDTQNADEEPAETLCLERYNSEEINTILKKAKINLAQTIKKYPIHYSKSKKAVSAFVIQRVVAKYVDIMQGDAPQPKQIKEIDEIVASFDKAEFDSFVRETCTYAMQSVGNDIHISSGFDPSLRIIGLKGRYGNADMIRTIGGAYDTLKPYYPGARSDPLPKVNKWKRYLKAALLMSDLPEACEYCINKGWTAEYAEIRGIDPVEVEKMAGMQLTPDERKIQDSVALYEKWVCELNDLMDSDRTYNEPTVKDVPRMSPVSVKDPLVERFYAAIRDKYVEKGRTDLANDLYRWWTNATCIEDGHIGVEFTVGLLVASYMFVSKNVGGTIVYCRDKWEYRGDYSHATRLCLYVSEDTSDWKAYMATGYREYDM